MSSVSSISPVRLPDVASIEALLARLDSASLDADIIPALAAALADLRRSFSRTVERLIVAEIAKDLTGLTVSDLSQYLTA